MPLTVSQIGEMLGAGYERTKYAIKVAGLTPIGKAGNVNLYRSADVRKIKATMATLGRIVRP
jgi:hypothetical protein